MQTHKANSSLAKIHLGTGERIAQTFSNRANVSLTRTNSGKRKRSVRSFGASGWLWVPKGQEIKHMGEKKKKHSFWCAGIDCVADQLQFSASIFLHGIRKVLMKNFLFPEKIKYISLNEAVVREG